MTDIKEIIQSPIFAKQKKKLHENRLKGINNAVKMIFENPDIGDMKGGDLQGIRICEFKPMNNQILLAYEVDFKTLYLYAFGSYEHFYRDLKKYIH